MIEFDGRPGDTSDILASRFPDALEAWELASSTYREAFMSERALQTEVELVIDMLMRQGYNTHHAIKPLASRGLVEDAATLARRLLELSIQTVYVGAESEAELQREKAGRYLAFLWRKLPKKARKRLPDNVRDRWLSITRRYDKMIPTRATKWGPNWFEMFRECSAEELYRTDYAFLSSVAHGSSEEQICRYSMSVIAMRDHRHVPYLVVYSSKYFATIGEIWNQHFKLVDPLDIEALRERLVRWRPKENGIQP